MERPVVASGSLPADVGSWPKAELHLHLDGSVLVDTALDLARSRGVDAPTERSAMARALVADANGASQAALLRAFDLPIALLQDSDALERVARELVEAKAAENVRYLEIRWAPLLHQAGGLRTDEVIAAVCAGTADAAARTGTVVRLIATALRSHDPAANTALAGEAIRFRDRGLAGWDLAGDEATHPDASAHAESFSVARDGGLRITCHAGEWGGAAQVRRALALGPERIAHGPGAADDPELCAELRSRGVTLDLCPTSNVQAGIVRSVAAHPLARLFRAGVSVTLSTDDLTVSDVNLTEEYRRAVALVGLTPAELWAIDRHALDVAFADEDSLARLRADFDAWARAFPAPAGGHQAGAELPAS
jgi:adenosine deaminase